MDNQEDKNFDANNSTEEVEKLHSQWKQFTRQQIIEAIDKVGPDKEAIHEYLQKKAETL